MTRLKKMPVSIREQLEKAGEMIASFPRKYKFTSDCVDSWNWMDTEECIMLTPMCNATLSEFSIKNRLMGIAIMITMPEEIINHECSPKQ